MEDAWQSQDIAPTSSGISIPTQDAGMNNTVMAPDDQAWNASGNGNGRSPGRDRNGDGPRRSSRSRSPGGGREPERGVNPGNNLHVSGLHHKVDTRDLEAAFAKIGRVKKASVMYDPHTRDSRGFGFVTMETAEEADAAITALNSTDLMGKVMNVEKARRGRARTPTPGRYYGPPKRGDSEPVERPYDPRPYDSRYSRDYDDRGRGGGGRGRYDDNRGGGGRDYDRGGHRDYDRGDRDRDRGYGRDYDRGERGGRGGYDDRRH
ncbi:putative RNA-binding protein C25G10.01 [Hypsizygus marmoreus]|uniref:RNA-binding protein C25G10.01 n=1 Tax=Hypsizygus marmoreus TaxID=39966 RepID=A0A369K5H3_HYPMA|nr:putative RNA-binding protein C25G10.01 [Hypsizygus marmoreus]